MLLLSRFLGKANRISSEQEGKSLYTSRPTRGLRFWEFSINSARYGFYPTCFNPYLSALLMLVLG